MDNRIESLINSLERNYNRWEEPCIDEVIGEEVIVNREEIISRDTTEEERNLMENIANDLKSLRYEEILKFLYEIVIPFGHRPFDEIYIELIRRGEEWALEIDNPTVLQKYSDKGNDYATYALYEKYMHGDEKNGIFINHKKAREYYDMVGDIPNKEEWDDNEDPGEDYPETYQYSLYGNKETINEVENLINAILQRFGDWDEFRFYVPQQNVMKELVDSDSEYYRGNIIGLKRYSSRNLIITTESNSSEPLLYALRYRFKNLNVEVKKLDL